MLCMRARAAANSVASPSDADCIAAFKDISIAI